MNRDDLDKLLEKYLNGESNLEEERKLEEYVRYTSPASQVEKVVLNLSALADERSIKKIQDGVIGKTENERKTFKAEFQRSWFIPLAASISLLIIGYILGVITWNANDRTFYEISMLKEEVSELKQSNILAKLEHPMAGNRLLAISTSDELEDINEELLKRLMKILTEDRSINVRLAAAGALYNHKENLEARKALVGALEIEEETIIQLTLINMMVQMQEKLSIERLKQLSLDNSVNEHVSNRARKGLEIIL